VLNQKYSNSNSKHDSIVRDVTMTQDSVVLALFRIALRRSLTLCFLYVLNLLRSTMYTHTQIQLHQTRSQQATCLWKSIEYHGLQKLGS